MPDTREAQIATWAKMRRTGKLRHICLRGLLSGAILAAAMVAVAWMKTGMLQVTIEAIVVFGLASLHGAISARTEWNRFASIYPDIGPEQDNAVR